MVSHPTGPLSEHSQLWKPISNIIIKPTRCINFSNLFLEWNSTCFEQFLCPSSGVFHCTHSNSVCHTGLQDQDVSSWSFSQAVSRPVWYIPLLCVQWKSADDGQRNCPKHVEFHSKNKFEKSVHLVGCIARNSCMWCWDFHHVEADDRLGYGKAWYFMNVSFLQYYSAS